LFQHLVGDPEPGSGRRICLVNSVCKILRLMHETHHPKV
jgi:hypothetical protein